MTTEQWFHARYAPKPIPDRRRDWEAFSKQWDFGMPIGYGATEKEAIDDLLEQSK